MGLFKHGGALVATLAVAIALIGKVKPELFLKVPSMGFVLWAITGNPMPPYFSTDAWTEPEMKTWIRDGDVVVATGAKSGTTWMLYCAHQIRVKGNEAEANFTDVSYSTPWPDLIHTPGGSWSEQKPRMETTMLPEGRTWGSFWNNPKFPFRVFKTHYTPKALPVKSFPKVKFLAMTRSGLDVVASLIPFFDSHSEAFRKIWGGFPPPGSGDVQKDAEARLAEILPGGTLGGLYFDYVKEWWPYRNEANVLLLHFSDVKKDLVGTVTKLAKFYGVDLTEAQHASVVKKCSFSYMKANKHLFNYAVPLNAELNAANGRIMRDGMLINKGKSGGGKVSFTAEQQARWNKVEKEQFPNEALYRWAREGGKF